MTDAEIAKLVAQALELKEGRHEYWHRASLRTLRKDGAEMFTDHWQVLCRDWLLERGGSIVLSKHSALFYASDASDPNDLEDISIECPASEFCARAIAQIMLNSTKDKQKAA